MKMMMQLKVPSAFCLFQAMMCHISNVGYLFSPMRFRVRGYNSQYSDTYINGVLFNDVETGRFSYGMIGGLNDATRNKEGIGAFEVNNFTFGPIGGATNINMRASQYAAGSKIKSFRL